MEGERFTDGVVVDRFMRMDRENDSEDDSDYV